MFKNVLKLKMYLLAAFIILGLISCGKKTDENTTDKVEEAEMETINADNLSEHDEDLLTVDYRQFYDELAPHGEWIEVKDSDIGIELKKSSSPGQKSISLGELFGIKDAHADVNFGAFFVWKPAPNLAVGITTGEPSYVPYTNGQWIYTDAGWYFRAATEPEEITHHYGRWTYSPALGWVWVPGRVWAPAWVDWREQETYIAWTPIPPSIHIINNYITVPPLVEERYIIVEKRYFIEPEIYRYTYKENKNKIMIKEWKRLDGVMVMEKTVINKGPDIAIIQNVTGAPVNVVKIKHVRDKKDVNYSANEFSVFSPEFRKVKEKTKINKTVSKPENYINHENAIVKKEFEKQEKKINDKTEEKSSGKRDKKLDNPNVNKKYSDDSDMKDGGKKREKKNSENFDKQKGKDKNKDNSKVNERKSDGNKDRKKDNGNKNNGSKNNDNKSKENKSKDKGKK